MTSIIACFYFSYVIYYKKVSSEIEEKQWDLSTVTTADFTVDIEIPSRVWPAWKEYRHKLHLENKEKGIHRHIPGFQEYFLDNLYEQMKKTKPVFKTRKG